MFAAPFIELRGDDVLVTSGSEVLLYAPMLVRVTLYEALKKLLTEELNDRGMVRTFGKDVTTTSEGRDDHEGDTDTFLY